MQMSSKFLKISCSGGWSKRPPKRHLLVEGFVGDSFLKFSAGLGVQYPPVFYIHYERNFFGFQNDRARSVQNEKKTNYRAGKGRVSRCQNTKASQPSSPGSQRSWIIGKSDSSRWETRCCSPRLSWNCMWERDTCTSAWLWRAEESGTFSSPPPQRRSMALSLLLSGLMCGNWKISVSSSPAPTNTCANPMTIVFRMGGRP